MRRFSKIAITGALLLALVLAAGAGVVLSQGTPEPSSPWETPSGWQSRPSHPCEGWVYEVAYGTADGKIKAAFARAPSEAGPPPGSGIVTKPGEAIVVLTDSAQIRTLGQLMASPTGSQDYSIDLATLTLKKRPDSAPVPSPTAESGAWPFGGVGVLPPLALVAGIGLSAVALVGARRRS